MSKVDIFIPITIGDYLKDTMHLSTEEHGAYVLMLFHYWIHGPIKNDKKTIKNITKITSKKSERILSFFEDENGYLIHRRADKEKEKAIKNQEVNVKRAKAAAEARWGNKQCSEHPQSNPPEMHEQCPSPPPISNSIITTTSYLNRVHEGNLSTDLSTSIVDKYDQDIDLNDVFLCVEIFKELFGRGHISHLDQMTLARWCSDYDMRLALLIIEHELYKFRQRNNGDNPETLNFFEKPLKRAASVDMAMMIYSKRSRTS